MEMTHDSLLELYRLMTRIRLFEEKIVELYPRQEMKTPVHLCIGQEAIAAGVCIHLRKEDYIFSTHRSHGHCIAKGMPLAPIAAELYGKSTGCCKGRGGSMHLVAPEWGIPGSTAIVGGSMPLAVGAALSSKMQENGRIAVAFFGDGASEEGSFHESLNFAALHRLPVVFVCENNFYATNSPQSARQPARTIAEKGQGYGIPGRMLDGNNVLAVFETAAEAVERARCGDGPTLLEYQTYRWKGHVGPSCDVDLGCRPREEHESWLERCPYDYFRQYLLAKDGTMPAAIDDIDAAAAADIDAAMKFGRESEFPLPEELYNYVA
jgi:TPP-dependent pyruvate/acetoin dehydrogenase alpha subunit